jgi:hypothetical protein
MKDSQYSLFERLFGYVVLGVVGVLVTTATVAFVVTLVLKVMATPPLTFVIGISVLFVLMGIGYCISCLFTYLDKKAAISYAKQYQKEQAEMAQNWITRGVTTVEWPYIPDKEVKDLIREYALCYGYSNHTTLDFSGVYEWLDEADEGKDVKRTDLLNNFMDVHELELNDTINYWW